MSFSCVIRTLIERALDVSRKLGGSLGASRPVVDMKLIPRQQQIGLTGSSISPELYVAIGISGSDNHVVGLRYSKKILAVNSDRNAPIFSYSDYGFVGDSAQFVHALSERLQRLSQ